MHWQDGFIAVDWGTTNRRAYRLDRAGQVIDSVADGSGVLAVPEGRFPEDVAALRGQLGGGPMLLAGMVGSSRGWIEVPYVGAPAGLAELAGGLHWVEADAIAIIPGVSLNSAARADVMRGEEVQALGALAARRIPPDALICHPGTHAKWLTIESGRITSFATAMTGEIFALLKDHSILGPQLGGAVTAGPAFLDAVDLALSGHPLLEMLFGVRSRVLLGRLDPLDAAAYASGLLIGSDVNAHRASTNRELALIGRPELCSLYGAALQRAGQTVVTIDGAEAFVAGMTAISRMVA